MNRTPHDANRVIGEKIYQLRHSLNLTQQELDALNKIVTAYLDIAEVHALNQKPMYMKDWLVTIDDYLKMTRRDILTSSGHISHKQALDKAHAEYTKYKKRLEKKLTLGIIGYKQKFKENVLWKN